VVYRAEYYKANKDKHKEYQKRYRTNNRERYLESCAKYRATHKSEMREWELRSKYGLTTQEFDSRLIAQGNKCALCGLEFTERSRPVVDHDHSTGLVRGLLHRTCNSFLGFFERYGKEASAYLRNSGG